MLYEYDRIDQGGTIVISRSSSRLTPNPTAIRHLERHDANLRRALRSAGPRATERIALEIEEVAQELEAARGRFEELGREYTQLTITPALIQETMDEMTGILEHTALEARVAWTRDLFERIEVDAQQRHVVPVWRNPPIRMLIGWIQ